MPTTAAWASPVTLSAVNRPVLEVLTGIAAQTGLSLKIEGRTRGILLCAEATGVPAHTALKGIAQALDMEWVIEPDGTATLSFNVERQKATNAAIKAFRTLRYRKIREFIKEQLKTAGITDRQIREAKVQELERTIQRLRETKPEGWIEQVDQAAEELSTLRQVPVAGTEALIYDHLNEMSQEKLELFLGGEPIRLPLPPAPSQPYRLVWVRIQERFPKALEHQVDSKGQATQKEVALTWTNGFGANHDWALPEFEKPKLTNAPVTYPDGNWSRFLPRVMATGQKQPVFAEGFRFTGEGPRFFSPRPTLNELVASLDAGLSRSRVEGGDGYLVIRYWNQPWMRRSEPSSVAYDRALEGGASLDEWLTIASDFDEDQLPQIRAQTYIGLDDLDFAGQKDLLGRFWTALSEDQRKEALAAQPIAFSALSGTAKRLYTAIVALEPGQQYGSFSLSPVNLELDPQLQRLVGFYLEKVNPRTENESPNASENWVMYFGKSAREAKTIRLVVPPAPKKPTRPKTNSD